MSGIVRNNGSVQDAADWQILDQLFVDFGVAAGGAGVEAVVAELPLSAADAFVSDFASDFVSGFVCDFPSVLLSAFESESLLAELLFEA
jgi:hypothetical protein